jgi:hypothetical protein
MVGWKIVLAAKTGNVESVRECYEVIGEDINTVDLV